MKLSTYNVRCDGFYLGYVRGANLEQAEAVAKSLFGGCLVGFEITMVSGLDLILDLIRERFDTTQKLRDRTRLTTDDIRSLLQQLGKMRLIRCYDGVWAEEDRFSPVEAGGYGEHSLALPESYTGPRTSQ